MKKKIQILYLFSNSGFLGEDLVSEMRVHADVRYIDFAKVASGRMSKFKVYVKFLYLLVDCFFKNRYIHVHYPSNGLYRLIPIFKKISRGVFITYWGSDLHVDHNRNLVNRYSDLLSEYVEAITFPNKDIMQEFGQLYGMHQKLRVTRFGLSPLGYIDNYSADNVESSDVLRVINARSKGLSIVVCGTNLSVNQQYERVIPLLSKLTPEAKSRCFFVFCFNYGDMSILEETCKLIDKKLNHIVIRDTLFGDDIAGLRVSTDVLIQLQKNDMLSGAMQESLYAGADVITGSWLKYSVLLEHGARYTTIDDIDRDLVASLESIVSGPRKSAFFKQNKLAIGQISSWTGCIVDWLWLYEK